jgi:putative transcriptional regulator
MTCIMQMSHQPSSLAGHLLVATAAVQDPTFRRSVVFVCAHSTSGAMGLIVNRPRSVPGIKIEGARIAKDRSGAPIGDEPALAGGPAEAGRRFVLHSHDYREERETLIVDPTFAMTASRTILSAIRANRGPRRRLVTNGYAGWAGGQLEAELAGNAWFTLGATEPLVYDRAPDAWQQAVARLGVDPAHLPGLSGLHGHA